MTPFDSSTTIKRGDSGGNAGAQLVVAVGQVAVNEGETAIADGDAVE